MDISPFSAALLYFSPVALRVPSMCRLEKMLVALQVVCLLPAPVVGPTPVFGVVMVAVLAPLPGLLLSLALPPLLMPLLLV